MKVIEEQIQESNSKYWKSRFLFGQEFTDFALDFATGYTSDWQKDLVLTFNNDFHLLGEQPPKEYMQRIAPSDNFDEPIYGKIPEDSILKVFKFAASFYIKVM